MAERSIFFEEWRRCLQEHYRSVIRNGDSVTERTLVPVLHRVGFSDDELRQLYMEATMRAELLAEGVVVDPRKLPFTVHPAECTCAACMDKALDAGHDAEGQPVAAEPELLPEPAAAGNLFAVLKAESMPDMVEIVPEMDEILPEPVAEEIPEDAEILAEAAAEIPVDDTTQSKKKDKDDKPKQMSMF